MLVWLHPEKGWGAARAFNAFKADLSNPSGSTSDFATLRIRPLMGRVSYTVGQRRILTSVSLVGGPSFNSAKFDAAFTRSDAVVVDADTSVAVRPGVSVGYALRQHVALIGFGGYLINRPGIVYRDSIGHEFRTRWRADAVVLSVGAVYSIF